MTDKKQILLQRLRSIQDFPKKGINFRDVTSWFMDPECMTILTDDLAEHYANLGVTKVMCIESRGFVIGSLLANRLQAGMVLVRKPGKLPMQTVSITYDTEYSQDTIEMAADAITPDDVVIIHDDLLATGGTAMAAYHLAKQFNPQKIYMAFLIEITDEGLHGRDILPPDVPTYSILTT